MYYHCRDLKHVIYDKVYPPPESEVDSYMLRCYKWLSHYLPNNYCPQVWLSRSHSRITGFKNKYAIKDNDPILFGFDVAQGFPVDYDTWEWIMNSLMNNDTFEKQNADIVDGFNCLLRDWEEEKWEIKPDDTLQKWLNCGKDLDTFLRKHLFIETDQIVVPSLNLKVAKKIICRNEKQKKILRKMGFIEDRIVIKNIKAEKY